MNFVPICVSRRREDAKKRWREDLDAYGLEWREQSLDRDKRRREGEAFAQQWFNKLIKKIVFNAMATRQSFDMGPLKQRVVCLKFKLWIPLFGVLNNKSTNISHHPSLHIYVPLVGIGFLIEWKGLCRSFCAGITHWILHTYYQTDLPDTQAFTRFYLVLGFFVSTHIVFIL